MTDRTITHNPLKNMMVLNENRTKRVSSWDQSGANKDFLFFKPGETRTIFDVEGPAVINHFYVTMASRDLFAYRRAVVRIYWDGEETPSVEVPIGDFFCIPFSEPVFFSSMVASVNPGANRLSTDGLNLYFPMPFAKHARIELFNDSDVALPHFWYHINYEEVPELECDWGYFHASWNRENPCGKIVPEGMAEADMNISSGVNLDGAENYVILDAEGRGNYAGCLLQVDNLDHGWYGEGDDMIFIDGEKWPPSLHGTGSEEIFGGGACPNEAYFTPYCGFSLVQNPKDFFGRNAMYKFFVTDPVRFQKSIRVTIEHGHANNLGNDYASTAYWYQVEPHAKRTPLLSAEARVPRPPTGFEEAVATANRAAVIWSELDEKGVLKPEDAQAIGNGFGKTKRAIHIRDAELALDEARAYLKTVEEAKSKHS